LDKIKGIVRRNFLILDKASLKKTRLRTEVNIKFFTGLVYKQGLFWKLAWGTVGPF